MSDVEQEKIDRFVQLLAGCQDRLFAYILSLVRHVEDARDVQQEVSVVLWQKRSEFLSNDGPGSSFSAWASRTAYFQVLAYLRDRGRDPHRFDPELLEALAADAAVVTQRFDDRRVALESCMERLPLRQRQLVQSRYANGGTVDEVARASGQTVNAVSMALFRARKALLECIERTLAKEGGL